MCKDCNNRLFKISVYTQEPKLINNLHLTVVPIDANIAQI